MRTLLMEELTWPEIRTALDQGMKTVVIFAGAVEQHGPHLAENTDAVRAFAEALDLAERLGNALVAPVIRPGVSDPHMSLPGTVSLRPETFRGIVEDYIASYVRRGFERFVLASTHGGNMAALKQAAADCAEKYPKAEIVTGYDMADIGPFLSEMERTESLVPGACGSHACDFETSLMLHLAPQHVFMKEAAPGHVGPLTPELAQRANTEGITALSENGVLGDPTGANGNRGARYFAALQELHEKIVKQKLQQKKY